ncbi:MAG: P-loop NTPase [Myxococcota bacterium]
MSSRRRGAAGEPGTRGDRRAAADGPARIWAMGGGKGGIGKTFFAANLAAVAARAGRRVIGIDADLGGANLHTALGVRGGSRINLSDFFEDRVVDLDKAALETPIPGLRLILGALGNASDSETTREQRIHLLDAARRLPADVIVLDLAAGMERSTLDFFVSGDSSFIVTTPEPTAVENAYAFLRSAFYRRLGHAIAASPLREEVRAMMRQRNDRDIHSPLDLMDEVDRLDPVEGGRFRAAISGFRPRLLLNQVRNSDDVKLGFSIHNVCRKYFGIDVDYVGYVNYDDAVWRSVKERRPLVLGHPQSDSSIYIRRIAKKLLED